MERDQTIACVAQRTGPTAGSARQNAKFATVLTNPALT